MSAILGLITARGGSKGVPGKNIRPIGGRPLIEWTIESAFGAGELSHVVVSTDDGEIAAVAREAGASVPFVRPPALAEDDSSHVDVVEHALTWFMSEMGPDLSYVVLLQPTSPFRTAEDIDAAVRLAGETEANAVVSVCEASEHPYLCREQAEDGTLHDFIPCGIAYRRRQALPRVYHPNGAIYCIRPEVLVTRRTFFPAGTYPYVMPQERSLQIDTMWDLRVAELVMLDLMTMEVRDGTYDTVLPW